MFRPWRLGLMVAALGFAALLPVSGSAQVSTTPQKTNHARGLVPRSDHPIKTPSTGATSANPHCSACNPPLLFTQGAPVMGGMSGTPGHVTITPVYWAPSGYSFASGYKSIINGYLQNIAAASGQTTNVYSIATEYYQQASGGPIQHIQYAITAGNEVDDAAAFPAQNSGPGCIANSGFSACVSDGGLQTELNARVSGLGLPIDDSHLYMVMFPSGVETCLGTGAASNTNQCSTNVYCAYHSSSNSQPYLVYANEPFPDLKHCTDPFNGAQAPNGDAEADTQISLISHEVNESITDWYSAWMDSAGYEDGDECAYVYGSPLGGGSGAFYNQAIGNGRYYTQDEFSNAAYAQGKGDLTYSSGAKVPGCLQRASAGSPAVTSISPATGLTSGGSLVTITGTGLLGTSAVSFGGAAATAINVLSDTQVTAVSPSHGAGAVDVSVTTGSGTSNPVTADQFTYVLLPISTCSTSQYTLSASDGSTWKTIDSNKLSITFTATANATAIIGGNGDLWTKAGGYNQDLGIAVTGPGFPSVAGQPEAWKESGGSAGTFSPNAAYVQAVVPVVAGQSYTATLVWKANKPDPSSIALGAGPINGQFSNTCLTVRVMPALLTGSSSLQYALPNSDGSTWQPLDATKLIATVTPTSSGQEVVTANADLWTANAGYNQDLGIFVSVNGGADQLVGWKESGGYGGTFSPNAAFLQSTWPVSAGSTYVFKLKWKSNKNANGATIYAGAGPIGGLYSTTRIAAWFESTAAMATDAPTQQYHLNGSDGATWKPIDQTNLQLTYTPSTTGNYVLTGNSDLWTANAGYNQDLAIFISGGSYSTPTLVAWKESGGFAGTFSPNAAYVETALNLQASTTYTIYLAWKTNAPAAGATISAGAGPLANSASYSPTRLTITSA